jgi:RNA polymerase sigma factor (sigma-70 family)
MDFDDEFDALAALAYRTAYRMLGSRQEAEEVAQEAMTRALMHWGRIEQHARGWVCRVASNQAIGVLRKRRRALLAGERSAAVTLADGLIDRVDLQRALLLLPRRQREVLVLRYVVDLPEAEVARALGLTVGTVKTHAHRALASIRVALAPESDIDPKAVL